MIPRSAQKTFLPYSLGQAAVTNQHFESGTQPCPIPEQSGLYAWYFADVPDLVLVEGCKEFKSRYLLYCGICPRRSSSSGHPRKKRTLRHRVKYHYAGNAYGSTLRLSLGCLLSDHLGIRLQVSESSKSRPYRCIKGVHRDLLGPR